MPQAPRVRFAPSPTGYLHVGGARTALFNYMFAKKHGGQFLLRIEDTDTARSTEESTKAIFVGLEWLGLQWDGEVVYQGSRAAIHRTYVQQLLAKGHAYRCFCTKERLDQLRAEQGDGFKYDRHCLDLTDADKKVRMIAGEPYVVRFKVPDEGTTGWEDLVLGDVSFPNRDLGGDFVILRSAHRDERGALQPPSPIYNLAVVCDDIDMGITHVLRGNDHVSNTPKQILIYQALGKDIPKFGHMPMIFGKDGKKLSKRHGATAVGDYANYGILPEAMVNFLGLLGWNPGGNKEIMTLDEMIELFSDDGLLKKGAVFDTDKLHWMNGQHIQRLPDEELVGYVKERMSDAWTTREQKLALVRLFKSRVRTLLELTEKTLPFTQLFPDLDENAVMKHFLKDPGVTAKVLDTAKNFLYKEVDWTEDQLVLDEGTLKEMAKEMNIPVKVYFQILRVALTGVDVSPPLVDLMLILGQQNTVLRLAAAERRLLELAPV